MVHADAPDGDHTPSPHVRQVATLVASEKEEYVPATQFWQRLMSVAPTTEDHLPAPQGVQSLLVPEPDLAL